MKGMHLLSKVCIGTLSPEMTGCYILSDHAALLLRLHNVIQQCDVYEFYPGLPVKVPEMLQRDAATQV